MGLTEEAGKVANTAVSAMSGSPLAIALLLVNIGFIGFAGYVLGEVATNASERNKGQMDLISKLVNDIRDCRGGQHPVTQLTPNFTLEEFTDSQTAARKGINNVPPGYTQEIKNLRRTAGVMETVRTILGDKPVLISSGYRCLSVNKAVGGSRNSAHMSGLAVDFSCPGFGPPHAICKKLEPHMKELGIDQLIHEYDTWCHLGLSAGEPRHMAMTIDTKGMRHGFA